MTNQKFSNVRVGYACLNADVKTKYRTCRQANLTVEKWHELIGWNLSVLKEMIQYNLQFNLTLFRLSSDLIPFGSADVLDYDWATAFTEEFSKLREMLTKIRFSMHPGQYTVLNSPNPDVVVRAIKDLEYHVKVLELLGATSENKLVLHIGGVYGDKDLAIERFVEVAKNLDASILNHLIIENDERMYHIEDVLKISRQIGIPAIFDSLHHEINSPVTEKTAAQWIKEAGDTWQTIDGRQIIHYSQQAEGKRTGAHSATIDSKLFFDFIEQLEEPLDIMLEVKDKNRSAEKLQMILNKDVKLAEKLWSRHKYSILSKSQPIYQAIRSSLKDKNQVDFRKIAQLFEEAQNLPLSSGDAINAAEHVWGYFKKEAMPKEKDAFRLLIENGIPDEPAEKKVRNYLNKMLKKYPNSYLADSYYFNENSSDVV